MALKFRRGTTAQKSGSLAFGEPYVNTTLGTLQIGLDSGDVTLSATGTGSNLVVGGISGSSLNITGNAKIDGNLSLGGQLTIGDQTSDTVNVVASLSSSLIPNITNTFDLGTADKIWRDLYISTGSIKFVEGNTVVKTLNANTITALEAATGSSNASFTNLNSTTASLLIQTSNLESFSSSALLRLNTIESTTASLNTSVSNLTQRVAANESVSSSYARTNSTNIFSGDQTITGSLFISADLVVQGSSSIQTISSSRLDIGDNIVQLNVNSPSLRFGGLAIFDSGSAGSSGSFLYDSLHDEFIFVHKGNGANVTSSHFVLGPETYDDLGNEIYITGNRIPKGTGNEHLNDSNITDTGTLITLGSNSVVNGTFYATGTTLFSSSAQIDATATTNWSTGIKTELNSNTVVSGSSQIDATATTNWSTGIKTQLNTNTVVSGSSQITLSSTTGGGTTSNVQFGSLGIGTAASGVSGEIRATADIVAYYSSDNRLKENIKPIEDALDKVKKISGNTYDWKEGFENIHSHTGEDVGVIAQEIEAVMPQLVTTREHGYKAVQYEKLTALLIEAIKEQQIKIDNLTIQIEELKKQKGL